MRPAELLARPLAYAGRMATFGWQALRPWSLRLSNSGSDSPRWSISGCNDVLTAITLGDIFSGIGKSVFFAFWVAIIGCYNGLRARGGADGVGRATTNTVVVTSVLVLVTDFFLTKAFYILF
jgi:hypothetical protein